jgi:RNA polymerase sigma factor (sigma-70 family)
VVTVPTSTVDWAAIYAEHRRAMRAAAVTALGRLDTEILGQSADDIVSGVVRELMVRGEVPTTTNLRGYLTAAVRNRVRDLMRRSRHEKPDVGDLDEMIGVDDIEAPTDRAELVRQALNGLDHLPERERYAITERLMKRRAARDIAEELGVTPQRISQLVNAGLGRLQQLPAFAALVPVDPSPPGPTTATGPDATGTPS